LSIRSSNRKHMRGSGRRFSSRFLWIIPSGCTHVLLSVSQAPTLRQQIIYKRFYNNPRTLPFSFRSSRLFIGGRGGCLVPLCASSSCARWFIVFSNGFSPCFFCSATPFFLCVHGPPLIVPFFLFPSHSHSSILFFSNSKHLAYLLVCLSSRPMPMQAVG